MKTRFNLLWRLLGAAAVGFISTTGVCHAASEVVGWGDNGEGETTAVSTQYSTLIPQSASAQSSLPDSFTPRADGAVTAMAVQADGKILVGGGFTTLGGQTRNLIARLNADGTLDSAFNPGANHSVESLAVQADGKILVGGVFTTLGGQTRNYIGRLNADGTLDSGFNPGANERVLSLTVQADGKILVGGYFTTLGGQARNRIARLNANGTLDTGFNLGANDRVFSLAVQADGKILVGGWFTTLGGQTRNRIARLNANGTLDSGFNPGANDRVFSLAVQADGKILVGGWFTALGGQTRSGIGRLNADGTLESGFNAGATDRVASLALQADGRILVGGEFTTLGGQTRNNIGRLNADGTLDSGFNPGADGIVWSLAVQADGRILVGGEFTTLGGQTRNYLGRLNNTAPATQSLTFDGSTITWLRGGTSPEVWRTTFDLSTDGFSWTSMGAGARQAGGWQLAVVSSPPPSGVIRGRGYITGGVYNGSGWFVETQVSYPNTPTIVEDPRSVTSISGTTATFTVNAAGTAPLAYHWNKDGVALADGGNVSGARSSVLTLANVQWADAGQYTVVVTNAVGTATSRVASLTVLVPPQIITPPQSQAVVLGANVLFSVTVTGTPPLNYQWRKNGVDIVGATTATLTLTSVGTYDSGGYAVIVWNVANSAVSVTASLAVLSDGANGNQPTQLSTPPPAAKPPAQDSLVIVTHGWQPILQSPLGPPPIPSWVTTLSDAISARVPDNWKVNPYDWTQAAWGPSPDVAIIFGKIVGTLYGQQLAKQQWQHVHLIGHSAGSAVIEAIAHALQSAPNPPTIHSTFLDPYTGIVLSGRVEYGNNADWADCYFAHDDLTTVFTEGRLDKAYNVNVTWADPDKTLTPIYCAAPSSPDSTPMMEVPCGQHASSSHDWPLIFYFATVLGAQQPGCTAGYGFPCSKEGGGWSSRGSRAAGNDPLNLCGPPPLTKNPIPLRFDSLFRFDLLTSATSGSGITFLGSSGFMLGSSSAQPLVRANGGGTRQRKDNYTMPGTPAWLAVGVTISNAVNLVQFDAGFTDTNAAQGLLTVYWNTNLIGMVDERTASPGLQNYSFSLPGTITEGIYTLSFRLDSFSPAASSLTVTNVVTGFVGLTQPITLAMLLPASNTPPVLQLTAPANYNYLIQSSTNLTNWTPAALLVNTNGTVLFAEPAATNFSRRFYRATMP